MAGELIDCPSCNQPVEIPFDSPPPTNLYVDQPSIQPPATQKDSARIIKKGEFIGMGCFVQALGIATCFLFFPIGVVMGIIILIIGGRMAIKTVCSDCGNKVDKGVKMCPTCKARFK